MRIGITLAPHRYPAAIPANHHPLAAFIYETVASVAPQFASYLHDEGLRPGTDAQTDKRFRFFVFSVPELPRYQFHDQHRWFERGVMHWQISSPLPEFIEAFVAGLTARGEVRIGQTLLALEEIVILEPPAFSDHMRFIALSPLTVATTHYTPAGKRSKYYLRAGDEAFGSLVASNLIEKYRALFGVEPEDPELEFEFDEDYIRRAGGVESRKLSRLIQYKETQIKSWQIPFIVSGNPELIALGWECGFGSANSQGFGMAGI